MVSWLREHLFDHVLSFWERHAIDDQGGLLTCISDSGRVLGTEKWLWSQWRAVWVFSRVYNELERDPKWLRLALQISEFCRRTGWDAANQSWVLLVSREGKVLRGPDSIYVDVFAICGLVELHRACGDRELLTIASRTADSALRKLAGPRDLVPHFPYSIPPGAKPHGLAMMWSLALADLGAATGREDYLREAERFSDEIFCHFYRAHRDLIVERVREGGGEYPAPLGTAIVPGHAIEAMWFQVHVITLLGRKRERITEAFRLILRHLELGWDHDGGGGIILAIDADGREPVGWNLATSKIWWPQTEALYAVLLGWENQRRPVFLDWYERLWEICLEHFVDWENGEWRQNLQRDFSPLAAVVALPVKDPFHLPRSLILQLELLQKQSAGGSPTAGRP
jgi:N-acylglucosamine 2-epimerase